MKKLYDEILGMLFGRDILDVPNEIFACGGLEHIDFIAQIIENVESNLKTCLYLIEEPERKLHPSLMKKLPKIFNKIVEFFNANNTRDIQFLISTHSPFIINSALELEN